MNRRIAAVALLAMTAAVSVAPAACVDHGAWDAMLQAHVDEEGFVDYAAWRMDSGTNLDAYLESLRKADLSACSTDARRAFWINAYNAFMVKKVLDHPEVKDVSENFGLFDEKNRAAGFQLTLDEIEHRILRTDPKKGGPISGVTVKPFDPRIHFVLVCGAIDCPKLRRRAFTAENVDPMMADAAADFANSPKHLRIERGQLVVSSLMKWYGDDFEGLGGAAAYLGSLVDGNRRRDADRIRKKLRADFPARVRFEYDWTLNDIRNKPGR